MSPHSPSSQTLTKKIYAGTFIHTPRLGELEVLTNACVGVDKDGRIAWIEPRVGEGVRGEEGGGTRVVREEVRDGGGGSWEEADVEAWVGEMDEGSERSDGSGDDERGGEGKNGEEAVEWYFPGFVDTHTHASQLPNAGLFGTSTLLSWLQTYTFPLESRFSSLPHARRVYTRAVASTLSHGTTTAAYYATIHPASTNLLASICQEKGQRAFVGRVCMDCPSTCPDYYRDESAEQGMRDTRAVVQHIRSLDPEGGLVQPILTPRFAPTCTRETLAALGKLAKEEDLHVQTHISETRGEVKLVGEMFPERKGYADVYDRYGLLTGKTVLAHGIYLDDEEVKVLRERGTGVSHCPLSNTSLGSGICGVRRLLDAGVKVGLGTDVSGGGSCSLLTAAREASGVSRLLSAFETGKREEERERVKLDVKECLYLATKGGAEVLGLGGKVGAFRVGMEWDAQMVRLEKVPEGGGEENGGKEGGEMEVRGVDLGLAQCWGKESWEEKVAKWMYCGDDRNTRKVWVKGRLVHERY